jgi:hypothetical protein
MKHFLRVLILALFAAGQSIALAQTALPPPVANPLDVSTVGTPIWDDFDAPNGTLINGKTTPQGLTWYATGTDQATANITGGVLTTPNLIYASLPYGKVVDTISAVFSFLPDGGTNTVATNVLTLLAVCAQGDPTGTQCASGYGAAHLNFGPVAATLSKYVNGTNTILAQWSYAIALDGSPHTISMSISGDVVTVTTPDGAVQNPVTDAAFGTATYGMIEILANSNAYTGRWHAFAMGGVKASKLAGLGGAAPINEATFLRGAGVTLMTRIGNNAMPIAIPASGQGWYRIATQTGLVGNDILGNITVTAWNPYEVNYFKLSMSSEQSTASGSIVLNNLESNTLVGQVIDQVRLSNDGSSNVALDVHVNVAFASSIIVQYNGYMTQVTSPVVGATAYTNSKVISISP